MVRLDHEVGNGAGNGGAVLKNRSEVEQVLPHSGQMVLLDRVIDYDESSVVSEVDVDSLTLFMTPSGLPAYVGIEVMAQSIAAWSGLIRRTKNQSPKPGFLLGTRKYECQLPYFPKGSTLRVHAAEIINNEGLATFACRLQYGGNSMSQCSRDLLAEARISVFSGRSGFNPIKMKQK